MKITKDNRLPEFKRIEYLLYGINYEVWLNLYGPFDPKLDLESVLIKNVSGSARLSIVTQSSPAEARNEILSQVLYEDDVNADPLNLNEKREEIILLINKVLGSVRISCWYSINSIYPYL